MEEFEHFLRIEKSLHTMIPFNKSIFNGRLKLTLLEQTGAHSHFFQHILSAGLPLLYLYKINPSLISSHKGFIIYTQSIPMSVQFISLVAAGY